MDLSATYTFAASPSVVWTLLIDPEVVAACLPGCEGLEQIGEDKYRVALKLAMAAVSGQYTGTVSILDKRPPSSYRLLIEGSGGPGFVKGEANVELAEQNEMTVVNVRGEAQVGGLMARVGQRLLGAASKMMMDRFFACLQQKAATTRPTAP